MHYACLRPVTVVLKLGTNLFTPCSINSLNSIEYGVIYRNIYIYEWKCNQCVAWLNSFMRSWIGVGTIISVMGETSADMTLCTTHLLMTCEICDVHTPTESNRVVWTGYVVFRVHVGEERSVCPRGMAVCRNLWTRRSSCFDPYEEECCGGVLRQLSPGLACCPGKGLLVSSHPPDTQMCFYWGKCLAFSCGVSYCRYMYRVVNKRG